MIRLAAAFALVQCLVSYKYLHIASVALYWVMPNTAAAIALNQDQKRELGLLVRNGNTPQNVALRCRLLTTRQSGCRQSIHRGANESVTPYDPGAARRLRQGRDSGGHRYSEAEAQRQRSE